MNISTTLGDRSDDPLTDTERRQIQRFTSDPLSFDEKFTFWLGRRTDKQIGFGDSTSHGAQVTLAADWVNPTDGTPDVIEWDTVEHDTNGYFVTATYNFVVPVGLGGQYAVSAVFEYDTTNMGVNPSAGIFVNDIPVVVQAITPDATGYDLGLHMMLSRVIHLSAGDTVDVRTFTTSGNQTVMAAGSTGMAAAFDIARLYSLEDIVRSLAMLVETSDSGDSTMGFYEFADATSVVLSFDIYIPQTTFDHLSGGGISYGQTLVAIGNRQDPGSLGFPRNSSVDTVIKHDGVQVWSGSLANSRSNVSGTNDFRDGYRWSYIDYWGVQDSNADGNWYHQSGGIATDADTTPDGAMTPGAWHTIEITYTVTAGEPMNLLIIGDYAPGNGVGESFKHYFDNITINIDGAGAATIADFDDSTYGDLDVTTKVSANQPPAHPPPGFTNTAGAISIVVRP